MRIILDYLNPTNDEIPKRVRSLWIINTILVVVFILSEFVIDLDGSYPGLSSILSSVLQYFWAICGIIISSILMALDARKRILSCVATLGYIVMGYIFWRIHRG
jgi:hypothetical protein